MDQAQEAFDRRTREEHARRRMTRFASEAQISLSTLKQVLSGPSLLE